MDNDMNNSQNIQRVPVYPPADRQPDGFENWKVESGNGEFRTSLMTWFSLILLLILYPGSNLLSDDPTEMLKNLNQGTLMFLLIATIIVQWAIFLVLYLSVYRERTGLAGLGFVRIRAIDFAWAIAFLIGANLILSGIGLLLEAVGMPLSQEIRLLIPEDAKGRVVWVLVSITAGICEETMFRGYLLTRLRLLGRYKGWVVPVIISSIAFGACHAYQGLPGFILIGTYGILFALLYIRTGTIWPAIIAHFFQDVGNLIVPQ